MTVLLAGILILGLNGCAVRTPQPTPTLPSVTPPPSRTAAPPYVHYAPSSIPDVHLEFDYPGLWYFDEEIMEYTGTIVVSLADPGILSVPTRPPDEPHGTPSDFAYVSIWIRPLEPDQNLETLVREQKQIDTTSSTFTLLADYPLEIDGYAAHALETRNDIPEIYTSVMFNRRIFLIAYDQVYTLDFIIAADQREGEFEQGYEYFFDSLRIVP